MPDNSRATQLTLFNRVQEFIGRRVRDLQLEHDPDLNDLDGLQHVLTAEFPQFARLGTAHHAPIPDCYGRRWNALVDEDCARCNVQTLCLHRFACKTVPDAEQKLSGVGDKLIAEFLDTESGAVGFAHEFQSYLEEGAQSSPPINEPETMPMPTADRIHSAFDAPQPGLMPTPRDRAARVAAANVVLDRAAPSSGIQNRPRAQNRQSVHPTVPKPPPQHFTKVGRPFYGQHTFPARFQRERERYPDLKGLPVGTTLYREWKDREIKVTIREDHYEWNGKPYATLYDIARTATGMVSSTHETSRKSPKLTGNWSGTRFFKGALRAVLQASERI